MKQNAWLHRSNIAASAVRTNDSCKNSDGSDFFNTLGYERTFSRPKLRSALPPKAGIPTLSGLCNESARSDATRRLREQPVATQAAEQVFISCLVCVGAPVSLSHQEVGINGFALREQGLCLVHRVEVRNRDRAAK